MIGFGHPNLKTLERLAEQGREADGADTRAARHVERCTRCRARVEALRAAAELASAPPALPENFAAHVMAGLPARKALSGAIVGEVRDVTGVMHVMRSGSADNGAGGVEAFPGMALREGDNLCALGDSLAQITLNDGSEICVNRDSEIEFNGREAALRLTRGALLARMRRQPRPFVLATPAATLTVLGTEFEAAVTDQKKTQLKVAHGAVEMKTSAGRAVVLRQRKAEAGAYTEPSPIRLAPGESVGAWAAPLHRKGRGHQRAAAGRAVLAIILLAAVAGLIAVALMPQRSSTIASAASDAPGIALSPREKVRQNLNTAVAKNSTSAPHENLSGAPAGEQGGVTMAPPLSSVSNSEAPIVDTSGMTAEQIVQAFFTALIEKDAARAVAFVAAPGDELRRNFQEVLDRFLAVNSIQRVTEVAMNQTQARVAYQTVLAHRAAENFPQPANVPMMTRTATLLLVDSPTGLKIDLMKSDLFGASSSPQASGASVPIKSQDVEKIVREQIAKKNYSLRTRTTTTTDGTQTTEYIYSVPLPNGGQASFTSNSPLHVE